MICIACGTPSDGLCRTCRRTLELSPTRTVSGVPAIAAYRHSGAAARLVHHLKYRRSTKAADFLGHEMARRLLPNTTALVPVPRALVRRLRYGVDPARELSRAIAHATGLPVVDILSAPVWWKSRAGSPRSARGQIQFAAHRPVPDGAAIVDDVLTSGATAASALVAVGGADLSVMTATAAGTMDTGADWFPHHGGGFAGKRQGV